ncbi:D-arabinono-1,4-lactone oxidase, partial [Bacillus cereus]|nr:D-arabinono-1,4-lactone oxidase [Bacillus cereus]
GRPQWGKLHTLSYEHLQYIYPEFHSFLQVRKSLDELGMFFNPYAEKLFIPLFVGQ